MVGTLLAATMAPDLPGNSTADPERASASTGLSIVHPDPYQFSDGLKTQDELAELRRRKQGKKVEKFHRRQNDVCTHYYANV